MMAGEGSTAQGGEQLSAKDSNEVNKITWPGRYSMRNKRPDSSTGRLKPKLCCTGTASGPERAIILLGCVPTESRIILVGKLEL